MADNQLFDEFDESTAEEWKSLLIKEVERSGKDANAILNRDAQLSKKPYYTGEDNIDTNVVANAPSSFLINDLLPLEDEKSSNASLLNLLMNGVESITISGNKFENLDQLTQGVLTDAIDLQWIFGNDSIALAPDILKHLKSINAHRGALLYDPIGNYALNGSWMNSKEGDVETEINLLRNVNQQLPQFRGAFIDGEVYHNAGASVVTEIACILSHLHEYLAIFEDNLGQSDQWINRLQLNVAVGKNYFQEIAKIRALRMLSATVAEEFDEKGSFELFIQANTSWRHLSYFDQHVNILRATTAAMSAVLGGCNALYVRPFDQLRSNNHSFSSRVSRNIQHMMKEESYLEKTIDPSSGSYMIEQLTTNIANKAWDLFQKIEADGGLLACLESGTIQEIIEQESTAEEAAAVSGKRTILGVNKHPNPEDEEIKLPSPQVLKPTDNQEIEPLRPKRLAQPIEEER